MDGGRGEKKGEGAAGCGRERDREGSLGLASIVGSDAGHGHTKAR